VQNLRLIQHLSDVLIDGDHKPYKAALCDAWGVIHNGVSLFSGAEDALLNFRREVGPVFILTNAPRPSAIILAQLDRLGLSRKAYDDIVTSGDAIRAEIQKNISAPFFRLGPEKDDPLYDGLKIDFVPLADANFIICTGLLDETSDEKPEDYEPMFRTAIERGVTMICANPDIIVRWGDRILYCAGALAAVYERLGGSVIHAGKPHRPIYDLGIKKAQAIDSAIRSESLLAIGDGLGTDIAGANAHGIDAVYVYGSGGIHDQESGSVEQALAQSGASALAAMEQLKW